MEKLQKEFALNLFNLGQNSELSPNLKNFGKIMLIALKTVSKHEIKYFFCFIKYLTYIW